MRLVVASTLALSALALTACPAEQKPEEPKKPEPPVVVDAGPKAPEKPARPAFVATFQPLPDAPAVENADRVKLGQMLYHEKRVSKSQDISCNTCHDLAKFGVDNNPTSTGFKGQKGGRNSPTTLNAALHIAQFWDGRAKDVEEQAKGPVLNPVEMAMKDDKAVLAVLSSMPEYVNLFQKAFPDDKEPMNYDNFGKAVGAFERQLITPSKLDAYLKGDDAALSAEELAGMQKFTETGCTACHNGPALGGGSFQKVGAVRPWEGLKDNGRSDITKNDADRFFFKVPSLRNISKTAPYFHDGSEPTLEGAIKKMASWQLGKDLTDAEIASIATFLKALDGTIPAQYAAVPELPASTPKTPKPVLQ
jgi:cytochrome c peroxidase